MGAIRTKAATLPVDFAPTMLEEPHFAARLAAVDMEIGVIEISVLRALTTQTDAALVSSLKIACTQAAQTITELWLELAARYRAPRLDRAQEC